MDLWMWAVMAVLLACLVASTLKPRSPPPCASPKEVFVPRYHHDTIPRPGDGSPLSQAFEAVVEPVPPGPPLSGQPFPYTEAEVSRVVDVVARRVNAHDPGLKVSVLSVDAVRKTVDAYKTARYEAVLSIYSKGRNVASKASVVVDLAPGGSVHIRALRVHAAAAPDNAGALPFEGAPSFSSFDPVLRY